MNYEYMTDDQIDAQVVMLHKMTDEHREQKHTQAQIPMSVVQDVVRIVKDDFPEEPFDDMEDRRLAMALWDFQCMKYGDHIGEGAYRVVLPYIENKLDSLEIAREHDDLFDKDRRMKAFIQSYHIAMFLRAMDYLVE